MLRLTINGKDAALSLDAEISITTNSPLLDPDNDDASYPFTLPLAANRHIFGEIERANVSIDIQYDAVLYFSANELLVGFGYISEITQKSVEFFIKTSGKEFMGIYGKQYLDQLELGAYPPTYGNLEALSPDTFLEGSQLPFVFAPVTDLRVMDYDSDSSMPQRGQINTFSFNTGKLYGADIYGYTCPFLFLHAFLKMLFEMAGYQIAKDQSLEIPGFERIYILCVNPANRYRPPTSCPALEYSKMLPHISVSAFFEELARKYNLRFLFDDNRKTVMIRSASKFKIDSYVDLTAMATKSLKKIIEEKDDLPENRRFYDKAIDLSDNMDSYDPTLLGSIKEYMEFNTSPSITEETQTEEIASISRTVLKSSMTAVISRYGETDISLTYRPVTINSLKSITSDLIFAIFNPIDPSLVKYRISEFITYAQPGGIPDINDFSRYYRFPESSNADASLSLLWKDYGDNPGLFTRFHDEYYKVMDASVQTHELELIPSNRIVGLFRDLFFKNAIVSGRRYLTKKVELSFSISGLKSCICEFIPL